MKVDADVRLVAGRVVVREIRVRPSDGEETVTAEMLRSIRISDLIADANLEAFQPITPEQAAKYRDLGPCHETIKATARTYIQAVASGLPPTKTVRETFSVSQATAGNWIGRARACGLISPSRRNRDHG